MKKPPDFDKAYEALELKLSRMNAQEFFAMLGVSIDELTDNEQYSKSISISVNNTFPVYYSIDLKCA